MQILLVDGRDRADEDDTVVVGGRALECLNDPRWTTAPRRLPIPRALGRGVLATTSSRFSRRRRGDAAPSTRSEDLSDGRASEVTEGGLSDGPKQASLGGRLAAVALQFSSKEEPVQKSLPPTWRRIPATTKAAKAVLKVKPAEKQSLRAKVDDPPKACREAPQGQGQGLNNRPARHNWAKPTARTTGMERTNPSETARASIASDKPLPPNHFTQAQPCVAPEQTFMEVGKEKNLVKKLARKKLQFQQVEQAIALVEARLSSAALAAPGHDSDACDWADNAWPWQF
ncbi:hypothetical protein THAOC_18556, partial [Thalassiosira oceanica]